MIPDQEEFIDACPAWVRKQGVKTPRLWAWIKELMPMNLDIRQEAFTRVWAFTAEEVKIAEQVLAYWDAMSDFHCCSCGETSVNSDYCKFCNESARLVN